jgi:hypothetical protein
LYVILMIHSRYRRAICVLFAALLVGGCEDELPTAAGPDRFPPGSRLASVSALLPAPSFFHAYGQFEGYTDAADAHYLLAANQFDGGVNARILLRPSGWPDSLRVGNLVLPDTLLRYTGGELMMTVDTLASGAAGAVTLTLRELTQDWDDRTATWELAADTAGVQHPWAEAGGALGATLGTGTWTPTGEGRDTLRVELDSLAVRRMAQPDFRGAAVVVSGPMARLSATSFLVRTGAQTEAVPDTTVAVEVAGGRATFIYDRPPPAFTPGLSAGGITSRRVLFRTVLPDSLSTCPSGQEGCRRVPIEEVNLNEVALVFAPLPVPDGFRPLASLPLRLRSVGLPAMGSAAPLGPPIRATGFSGSQAVIPPAAFATQQDTTVVFAITEEVIVRLDARRRALRAGQNVPGLGFDMALLAEPEGAFFGFGRFTGTPELRLVYTLSVERPD